MLRSASEDYEACGPFAPPLRFVFARLVDRRELRPIPTPTSREWQQPYVPNRQKPTRFSLLLMPRKPFFDSATAPRLTSLLRQEVLYSRPDPKVERPLSPQLDRIEQLHSGPASRMLSLGKPQCNQSQVSC